MPTHEALVARQVLAKNLKVRKGESVAIEAWTHSLNAAAAFAAEARRLGARPTVLYEDESAWWDAVRGGRTRVLGSLGPAERALLANSDVFLYFWGPEDRPAVDRLPAKTQDAVTGWNEEWYKVARRAKIRGCRMSVAQATDPMAREFGLNGASWRKRLLAAGAVNAESMRKRGYALARRLANGSKLRVVHPNGTDLTILLNGVHSRVESGIPDREAMRRPYGMLSNNPSGQVMTAVDRGAAEGTLVANRSVYIGTRRSGGDRWTFSGGRLVKHSTGEGSEYFEKAYAAAPKGRDVLGYFSIGLNPRARNLPPCEDTEEGAVLVGIGSNAFVGGSLRIPFQAYAMVGGATVTIDGAPIARNGHLL